MSFFHRITAQARERGYVPRTGNVDARAVAPVTPVVERALDRVADDAAAAEVGVKMGTVRVQHRDFAVGGAEGNELFTQYPLGDGAVAQFAPGAEQIPGGRVRGKAVGSRGGAHING